MNPFYSQTYKRSSMLSGGGSFGIYASWFEKQLALYPRPVYSIGSNNPVFSPFDKSLLRESRLKNAGKPGDDKKGLFKTIDLSFDYDPSKMALEILEKAFDDPAQEAALRIELSPLVLPETKDASNKELIAAMRNTAGFGTRGRNG